MSARAMVVVAASIAACRGGRDGGSRPDSVAAASRVAPTATQPDTMVLAVGGYRIWMGEGRVARDSAGATCYERSVSIAKDTVRTIVPLLFTTRAPTRLDDRAIQAELTKNCHVMAVYRVDLATGRPTKLADR